MIRVFIVLIFICSCSSSDNSDQEEIIYNYIYSATIPQIIENENIDRKFWVRAPKKY